MPCSAMTCHVNCRVVSSFSVISFYIFTANYVCAHYYKKLQFLPVVYNLSHNLNIMADLDDFFAKKDRKKSKTSKKFSTTDEVAKKLEDTAKKTEKQKKERAPEGEEGSVPEHEQDEWKDFEEEKKDYTGLKIGNLTISANAENNVSTAENNAEQQEGSEPGQETEKKSGPWKRIDQQGAPEVVEEVKVEKKPEPATVVKGAYVPPSLRNQSAQPQTQSRLRSKGTAPDIHNEDFFPTLSKSSEKKTRSEGTFEVVQHNRSSSYRQVEQSKFSTAGPKLNLGNRYNTLSNNDS